MIDRQLYESLPKETLIKVIEMLSKNWLTVDGLWFQGVEDKYGLEAACEIDLKMWEKQASIEGRRIKELLNIPEEGPAAVFKAAKFMSWAPCFDPIEAEEQSPKRMVFRHPHCRIQEARLREGRGEFPCKPMGSAAYTGLAKIIDPRVKVECLVCPPDQHPKDFWCKWLFQTE